MPKPIREILDDHIASILSQLEPTLATVALLERELADARKARAAIEAQSQAALQTQNMHRVLHSPALRRSIYFGGGEPVERKVITKEAVAAAAAQRVSPYAKLTIKQLVRKALDEHFSNGATSNELLDFFRDAWGRDDVVRTSLSPQLSRLKREGIITLQGVKWRLAHEAYLYDENEAPSGNATGASDAGPKSVRSTPRAIGFQLSRPLGTGESE